VKGIDLRPGRPLLAASARPWAGALLACCAVLLAVLGVLFAHQGRADGLDRAVDSRVIAGLGGHRGLLLWLAAPGSLIPAGVLCVAVVAACLLAGRLNGAVLAAVAVPVAVGLDEVLLKPLVHRTYGGNLVYPSGHATAVFTLAATVTVLLLVPPRPTKAALLRVLIPVAACALGVVVCHRRHRPAMALLHRYRGRRRRRYRNGLRAGAPPGPARRPAVARAGQQPAAGPGTPEPPGAGRYRAINLSRQPVLAMARRDPWRCRPGVRGGCGSPAVSARPARPR
jgi:hypothetical protein